jgi:DNA replication protein DnaC
MPTDANPEACPECGGRGWVVEGDGRAGTARPCACQSRGRVPRLLSLAGVPPRYQGCTLANFRPQQKDAADQLLAARAAAQRYVEGFLQPDGGFCETGLLFVGPPGVGKTHLAVAVLLEVIQRWGVQGRFVDFTSLLHEIQSTFDPSSPESKHDVIDPVMGAELLLLDELGAQQPTAWVSDVLYLILNTRYTRRLPTLFTTNYRLEPGRRVESLDRGAEGAERSLPLLRERVPAALVSRLYEMAQPVPIEGTDFRRNIKSAGRHP